MVAATSSPSRICAVMARNLLAVTAPGSAPSRSGCRRPARPPWRDGRRARTTTEEPSAADARGRAAGPTRRVRPCDRAARGVAAGRAGPDGRRHQRAVPAPVPPLRRRPLRQRDGQRPRAGRGRRQELAAGRVRRRRVAPQHPALRHRPGHHGRRGAPARRRRPRRPHRPQLRLPGAQGHPPRRRVGPPAQAPAAGRGGRPPPSTRPAAGAGHGQGAQGHRRRAARPTSTPAGSPRTRARPPSRCTPAPRPSSTRAGPTGRPSPSSRRRARSRCWATATSGRPPTPCACCARPAPTASSSAGAASVGRGCSATWSTCSTGATPQPAPPLGEVVGVLVEHARLLAEHRGRAGRRCATSASTPAGTSPATRSVATCAGRSSVVGHAGRARGDRRRPRPGHRRPLADAVGAPRGTQSGPQQVTLPDGWLDHRDDLTPPPARPTRWSRVADRPT